LAEPSGQSAEAVENGISEAKAGRDRKFQKMDDKDDVCNDPKLHIS
jgi:hypothetical protein